MIEGRGVYLCPMPEIRSEQIKVINSLLIMQMSFTNLETDSDDDINREDLREMAKQTYDHLVVYLIDVRQLYDKGIDAKAKMEEMLEIGRPACPHNMYQLLCYTSRLKL